MSHVSGRALCFLSVDAAADLERGESFIFLPFPICAIIFRIFRVEWLRSAPSITRRTHRAWCRPTTPLLNVDACACHSHFVESTSKPECFIISFFFFSVEDDAQFSILSTRLCASAAVWCVHMAPLLPRKALRHVAYTPTTL